MPIANNITSGAVALAERRGLQRDVLATARQHGYLRTDSRHCLLSASDDLDAVNAWLAEYATDDYSRHTQDAARRESERLVLWAATERDKSISALSREDMLAYRAFLANPQPRKAWCGPRVSRSHPRWRPFNGPLSKASAHQAIVVINGLFSYLQDAGYLSGNPIGRRVRRGNTRKGDANAKRERLIDPTMWRAILHYIDNLPTDTPRALFDAERIRFVFVFMYLLAPRVSDMANHCMGDLEYRPHHDGTHGWWWDAVGKGDRRVAVPVPNDAMSALRRWRVFTGRYGLPVPDEGAPLVCRFQAPDRGISANMIYRLIKGVMKGAADSIAADNPEAAERLKCASPHWIRHAALSRLSTMLPLSIVRDLGRHTDIKTTSAYVHTADSDLYSAAQKHRMEWPDRHAPL
jgi:integrase